MVGQYLFHHLDFDNEILFLRANGSSIRHLEVNSSFDHPHDLVLLLLLLMSVTRRRCNKVKPDSFLNEKQ